MFFVCYITSVEKLIEMLFMCVMIAKAFIFSYYFK